MSHVCFGILGIWGVLRAPGVEISGSWPSSTPSFVFSWVRKVLSLSCFPVYKMPHPPAPSKPECEDCDAYEVPVRGAYPQALKVPVRKLVSPPLSSFPGVPTHPL